MLGIVRPTRGLEFAESAHSIEKNVDCACVMERSWDKPLPDAFNDLVFTLLGNPEIKYIWIVEEDVVVPQGALLEMWKENADIVAINYKLKHGGSSFRRSAFGELLWVSLGCTLIKRQVFEKVTYPWFKTGYTIASIREGNTEERYALVPAVQDYAGHDAYFCWNAKQAGMSLALVEGMEAGHLVLDRLGYKDTNQGCHVIRRV